LTELPSSSPVSRKTKKNDGLSMSTSFFKPVFLENNFSSLFRSQEINGKQQEIDEKDSIDQIWIQIKRSVNNSNNYTISKAASSNNNDDVTSHKGITGTLVFD